MYADAIHNRGGALLNCVGFIDGTKIKMARPKGYAHQRSVWSGHKRMHCFSYQTITTPDGLIFHMYGPVEGRQPDAYLYCKSKMDTVLEENMKVEDVQYCIYGDQAYVLRSWMQTGYPRLLATEEQIQFNNSMNAARVAVEWSYKDVKQEFASQDFHRKLLVRKLPISNLYIASVLLRNIKTCICGGGAQPTEYFDCPPPSLQQYLGINE